MIPDDPEQRAIRKTLPKVGTQLVRNSIRLSGNYSTFYVIKHIDYDIVFLSTNKDAEVGFVSIGGQSRYDGFFIQIDNLHKSFIRV